MKGKKILATVAAVSMLTTTMFGCSGAGGSSTASTSAAKGDASSSTTAASVQTVKYWHYFSNETGKAMQQIIDDYNKSQSKIVVKGQYVPFADLKKQITVGAAASSLPDIVQIDNPDHASFSAMGVLADITDKVKEWGEAGGYYPGPISSAMYNGKYYGLPIDSNCLCLFYNKDLTDKAGIKTAPKTWDELEQDSAKLTTGNTKGFCMSCIKTEEGTFQFMPFLWQSGADYNSLDSSGAISAFTYVANLVKKGYMSKDVVNQAQGDILSAQWEPQKAAIMLNGTWKISQIKADKVKFHWGVWELPTNKNNDSVLGGENIAIIKSTSDKEAAAWDFVKYFSSKPVAEKWYKQSGYMPCRKDVADSSDYWKSDPLLNVFREQMNTAKARGPHPKWPSISEAIQTAEQKSITGSSTPADAAKEAAASVSSLLS